MQFSEAGNGWRDWPRWAHFILRLGFAWPQGGSNPRRIALISMPCDSAGAGLLALGAMRRRLILQGSNDISSHWQRIEGLANLRDSSTVLRHIFRKGRFVLDKRDRHGLLWVKRLGEEGDRQVILPYHVSDWHFEGEAPVQVLPGSQLPFAPLYSALMPDEAEPHASNLTSSDSAVCLAGRVAGSTATRMVMEGVRLRVGALEASLAELLTIHSWTPGRASRISFYNPRTGDHDRVAASPKLVIADGDPSLLAVLSNDSFRHADVVGVFHRVIERERLEAIGQALIALGQWYEPDEEVGQRTGLPLGIAMAVLKKR